MRHVLLALLLAGALATGAAIPVRAQSEEEQRSRWEDGTQRQRDYTRQQFERAGFSPIADVMLDGREVRRLMPGAPYFGGMPAIEMERHAGGTVTLALQYRGWQSEPAQLDPAIWTELIALEPLVFAPPVFVPREPRPAGEAPPPPPPVCHGWSALMQRDRESYASWHSCADGVDTDYRYATVMIEAAFSTRPDCSYDPSNPLSSFQDCFRTPTTLDDPVLERRFAELQRLYREESGLDSARQAQALTRTALDPGSPDWLEAQRVILAYREASALQKILRRDLYLLLNEARSPGDRARIQQRLDDWDREISTGDDRLSNLMQRLLFPAPH